MSTISNYAGIQYASPSYQSQYEPSHYEPNHLEMGEEPAPTDTWTASGELAELAIEDLEKSIGDGFNRGTEQAPPTRALDQGEFDGGAPCGHSLADSLVAAFNEPTRPKATEKVESSARQTPSESGKSKSLN